MFSRTKLRKWTWQVLLVAVALAVLLATQGCTSAADAMEIWTQHIHPAAGSTYDIGDNATRFRHGYFDNVTTHSITADNATLTELWVADNTSIHTFDNSTWGGIPGPQGPSGPQGPTGDNGTAGVSILWQGTFASPPDSPDLDWAYRNSTDNVCYVWDGAAWKEMVEDGPPGPPGPAGSTGPQGAQGEQGPAGTLGLVPHFYSDNSCLLFGCRSPAGGLYDLSGSRNHGTLYHEASWSALDSGLYATSLDGTDDYASFTSSSELRAAGDKTIVVWLYERARDPSWISVYLSNFSYEIGGWALSLTGVSSGTAGYPDFRITWPGGWGGADAMQVVPLNTWTLIVAAYSNGYVDIYVDNVRRVDNAWCGGVMGDSNKDLYVGMMDGTYYSDSLIVLPRVFGRKWSSNDAADVWAWERGWFGR